MCSQTPTERSEAEHRLETPFNASWRSQNALFCTYMPMFSVHQTVFHVIFGDKLPLSVTLNRPKAKVWGNFPHFLPLAWSYSFSHFVVIFVLQTTDRRQTTYYDNCQTLQCNCNLRLKIHSSPVQAANAPVVYFLISGQWKKLSPSIAHGIVGIQSALYQIYTVSGKKEHVIFDYKSRISWWIFIIVKPLETGTNTPQSYVIYLLHGLMTS